MGLTEPEQMRFRELQEAIFSALRDGDLSKVEALQNEQGGLRSVLPVYVHSLSESEVRISAHRERADRNIVNSRIGGT
jgi:hypothetical protein